MMSDTIVTNNVARDDVLRPIVEAKKAEGVDLKLQDMACCVKTSSGVISNCVFTGNSSFGLFYTLSVGSSTKVDHCLFDGNVGLSIDYTGTMWGGVIGGGEYNTIRNCQVTRNRWEAPAGLCGTLFFSSGANGNHVENCTICDNTAVPVSTQYGVGPYLTGKESCWIVNSVCLGNKYTSNDKEWNLHLGNNAVQSNCYTTVATAADYKDPKFRDRANGDYRLRRTSPLRDAGQKLDWMTEGSLDLAGQGRVNGENPDIGCYEYWWYSTGILLFVR